MISASASPGQSPARFNIAEACCDKLVEVGHGDRVAIYRGQGAVTFRELQETVNRLGNGFRSLGLGPGDRFLIRLSSCVEFYAAFLAGLKIGAVAIPTPQILRERELRHIVNVAEVSLAVTSDSLAEPIRALRDESPYLRSVACLNSDRADEIELSRLIAEGDSHLSVFETTPDDTAFILFSSGTTGVPKGIVHAHRGFNVYADNPCGKVGMALTSSDVVLHPHDPAWSYSLGCGFLFPLCEGAAIVSLENRIAPKDVLAAVERYGVTILGSVPTYYRAILSHDNVEQGIDLTSLRHCLSAGEPLTTSTYHEWYQRIGVPILDHIGQSETSMFCANTVDGGVVPGSLGKPLPGFQVTVLNDQGRQVIGEVGQLAIADDNPGLFCDYLGMPEKWEDSHKGGWYYTGDLARQDTDGNIWYVSRSDDLITTRGYLVSPKEVEDTLVDHPSVLEAAVVGVPDDGLGQAVVGYIVVQPGVLPTTALADELIAFIRTQIAPFKAPREVVFRDELPKTPTGKILRRTLREMPMP